jgi:hypothetical protein
MNGPDAFAKALAAFPLALRELVRAEVAAGNCILEISGGFPAPPAGASVKLARKVGTRPRASGDGLVFHERRSSLSSGDFTDAKRFFFVLEPPDPPPPESDMDAIRRAREPKPDLLAHPAGTATGGTRDLREATPPAAEAALRVEASPDPVAAIQQAIVAALKRGRAFGTSHKEGGTRIFWRTDRFIRSDYGDCPDHKEFTDEAEFLRMLFRFFRWDVVRHAGADKPSEADIWKLILRRLDYK